MQGRIADSVPVPAAGFLGAKIALSHGLGESVSKDLVVPPRRLNEIVAGKRDRIADQAD